MYRFCVVHMVHDMYIWIYCVNKEHMYVEIWIIVECVHVGDEHARGGHDLGMA